MNQNKTSEISLLLTDDIGIKELNKKYRNTNTSTDVLAFSQVEEKNNDPLFNNEKEYLLGDIVISVETAQRQAISCGHSLLYELMLLSIHGFLHLIGLDHDYENKTDKMKALEKEIINNISLGRRDIN